MRGQQKSKRVTWASDDSLCQVKLFLSEESPSQVGLGAQDHLQAKISLPLYAGLLVSDDNLPPGFESAQPASLLKNKLAQIPVIKWRRPPPFVLDTNWRVVAGEESNDMEVQKQQEMRVLEAIYPRESSIPPNPSIGPGDETLHNDQNTPVIPITPVEEEEVADPSFGTAIPTTNAVSSTAQVMQPGVPLFNRSTGNRFPVHGISSPGVVPGVGLDAVAEAEAALAAFVAENGQRNLIDGDLLMKILRDPKIFGQLFTHQGVGTSSNSVPAMSTQSMSAASHIPNSRPQASSITAPPQPVVSRANPSFYHSGRPDPPPVQVSRTELVIPSVAGAPNGPFHSAPSRIGPIPSLRPRVPEAMSAPLPTPVATMSTPTSSMPAPVARDVNYYKSLIQQHGGERQETLPLPPQYSNNHRNNQQLGSVQESQNSYNSRDPKPKIMKPCIYYNSSRGCRHGANCAFLHEASISPAEGGG